MTEHGERLPGGNVGGAWRVGDTVRRVTGPWTPAVHAYLNHLSGLRCVPRVHGFDEQSREVLDYLPGEVVDVDSALLSDEQLVSLVAWTRELHVAASGFEHAGPWRFFGAKATSVVGHNDLAPYNVCFSGDELVGVFDWDLAGPSTPLLELGWIAWQCVPLVRAVEPDLSEAWFAGRLELVAATYGGLTAAAILEATVDRVDLAIRGIEVAVTAGDPGMISLAETTGEPEPMRQRLAALHHRVPAIRERLG